ncbi:MAG: hypothetical protein Q7R60_02535 [bacterium]|nr:hypothetical protein [bacterium]
MPNEAKKTSMVWASPEQQVLARLAEIRKHFEEVDLERIRNGQLAMNLGAVAVPSASSIRGLEPRYTAIEV